MNNCNAGAVAKAKPDACPAAGAVGKGMEKPKASAANLVGDPVDIATGALRQSVTDIDLGGGLAFTRLYANDLITESTSGHPYLGQLGANWAHSLEWALKRNTTSDEGRTGEIYLVRRPLGILAAFFKLETSAEFSARPGSGSLVESGSNVIFTDADGTRAVFDGSLALIELALPGQLPIAVSSGSNSVTYARGSASLVLTKYGSGSYAGLIESVSGDGETVTFSYAGHSYSSYSDPVLETVVAPDRSTASTSDTVTWTYDYASLGGRGGRLEAVKRGTQTISSWEWGTDMGAVRVLEVDEPALDQPLVLDYHEPASSGTWTTKIFGTTSTTEPIAEIVSTKPEGPATAGDTPRILSVNGDGGPGYELLFEAASTELASNGTDEMQRWRILQDGEGRKTLYENYARDGAPGRIVEGWVDATSGGGVGVFSSNDTYARLREFTWHPRLERPFTVTEPSTLGGSTSQVLTYDFDDPDVAGTLVTDRVYRRIESGQTLDAAGDPVAVTYTTTYAYDSLFRLASIAGPRTENKTVFGYDGDGTGGTTGFRNSMKRCLNTGCTSYLETTFSSFDARGNPGTVTDPNGRVTTFTHDGLGRVRSVTPPWSGSGSSTVNFTYGADENLSRIDFPSDSFGSASYLVLGYTPKRKLEFMVDAQGNALVWEYVRSRVEKATRYSGFTSMTSRGTLRGDSKMIYDLAGRLVKSFNPLYTDDSVFTHVTGRDGVGNPTDVLDENGKEDEFTFDSLDRLLELAEIRSSTYETDFAYDSQSSVTKITDPGTKVTDYRNDDFGRLVEVTSPDTGVTRYLYDAAGNLISKIEDAEGSATRTTTYVYDPLNRLLEVDLPNDPDWDFTYDTDSSKNQKSRLASVTNGVVTTAFEYTDRGQVKKETTTVGGLVYAVSSTWDKSGKLETVTSPSGVVTTAKYRGLRPREVKVAAGYVDHTIEELEFLPFGPRTSAKIPPRDTGTGHNRITSTREYNSRMQPTEIEVEDSGTLTVLDRRYAYDYRGGSPGPVEKGPNLDELIDDRDGSESRFFFYDELDRLWKATDLSGTAIHTYLYDAGGNRTSEATSGGTATFEYETATNRLTAREDYGPRHYRHDAYGNRIYDSTDAWSGAQTLYYNDENRLVEARDPSNPSTVKGTYVYDAFGRRVKKVGNGVTQVLFYGPDGQMVEEVSPRRPLFTTDVARRYVHVDGELLGVVSQEVAVGTSAWTPVAWQALPPETRAPLSILFATLVAAGLLILHPRARRAAATVAVSGAALSLHSCTPAAAFAWVHTDILGTPLAVTDSPATGTAIKVVWRASYEPFGNATVAPNLDGDGNAANDFVLHVRFPGQYLDGESGYHYNYFRTYDPATGRYLEADPIGQRGGLNLFLYAKANAIRNIDPTGTEIADFGGWGFPTVEEHFNRNARNYCPRKPPASCPGWSKDVDAIGGKYRSEKGYECAYDERGNLLPDDTENNALGFQNYSFNYGGAWKSSPKHLIQDIAPHFVYGGWVGEPQGEYPDDLTRVGDECGCHE